MYDLARNGYTSAEIAEMLRSNRTVTYQYELLDRNLITIGSLTATGSIDFNSEATIKRAASLEVNERDDVDFLNDRVRIYMCLHTSGGIIRFPLGVFLMSSPSRQYSSGVIKRSIDCYDLTQILVDDKFTTRYIMAAGANYISTVAAILQEAGFNEMYLTPSDLCSTAAVEFEIGTSRIEAINKLLKAINYNDLYADEYGLFRADPYVQPEARSIEGSYVTDKKSVILSGIAESLDAFSAPNKVVRWLENAEKDYIIATAINSDPNSKLSTVSRGRTIVDAASVSDIADSATLTAYTQRVLAEQSLYQTISFQTAAMPNHGYLDCLSVVDHELGLSGAFIETAWNLNLSTGGTMSHICRRTTTL